MTVLSIIQPSVGQSQLVCKGFQQVCGGILGATALTLGMANTTLAQVSTPQIESPQIESPQIESPQIERSQVERSQIESSQPENLQIEEIVRQVDSSQVRLFPHQGAAITPPAAPAPTPAPFSPVVSGIVDLSTSADVRSSVGQLRPSNVETLENDDVNWLKSVILPLYASPDGDHWGWIYQGWLIPKGHTYLAIGRDAGFAMVRAYENLYTFPVLETREDGWFRVQYTEGGSAWAHTSQLGLGEISLTVEGWGNYLAAQESVYFLDSAKTQPLRSQPESANNMLSLVPADSLIEPTVLQGDWMLVRVTRPIANCTPLTGATVTEGWMRWRAENGEALAWHRRDDHCLPRETSPRGQSNTHTDSPSNQR